MTKHFSLCRIRLYSDLWRKFFRDPSQWWDNRSNKANPRSPDFKNKITQESLWIDGRYNPPWVRDELIQKGLKDKEPSAAIDEQATYDKAIVSKGSYQNIVAALKACAKPKDLSRGTRIHADIQQHGLLGKSSYVANALISMYARCGALPKAQEVLESLPVRNVVSWSVLIAGYAQNGLGEKALSCFNEMQREGFCPDAVAFACTLKACGSVGAAEKGKQIHDEIVKQGLLGTDIVLANALVDMYAKCGMLANAHQVLDKLLVRNVVTWNALIAGYVKQGYGEEALNCFEQMQYDGICPDAVTFGCILKACGSMRAVNKGKKIHDEITKQGLLGTDVVLGNALVDMYAKSGVLAKAQQVLDELPARDVVAWNSLIAGYAQHRHDEEALNCFQRMQWEGIFPDAVTFTCILKACGSMGAVSKGKQIHDEIVRQGLLGTDIVLANAVVDMYAKCGVLEKAQKVLLDLSVRSEVTWNSLIVGYVQHGQGEEALKCFEWMECEGICPNAVTFCFILKACGSIRALDKGKQTHNEITRRGMLEINISLGTGLVDMYVKCDTLSHAQQVLDELPVRDTVTWNALIAGYAQSGHGEQALNCYERLCCEGLCPDPVTLVCILKACAIVGAIDKGKQIHDDIVRQGLLGTNIALANALVDMYARCGMLAKAQQVLDDLPVRDVVSWSALIAGYTQHGHGEEALNCYERMQREGICPNDITYTCTLKACGCMGAVDKGKQIHKEIIRERLLGTNVILGNALVDMYAKCGALAQAQQVLEELPVRDVVSWSTLIAGYAQHGYGAEALKCFERMQDEGLCPNMATFTCTLKACGSIGAGDKGKGIHDEIVRRGLFGRNIELGNALVDMYAKCGALAKAQEVLDELPVRNVVSWSALIAGYAQHGHGEEALGCFERMQREGLCPNAVTMISVLNACSHSGLLDEGQMYFQDMSTIYGITPDVEHYTCMVDLFGRAGHFDKAFKMIKRFPSSDCLPVWTALLGACRKWRNEKLGRLAFEHAVHLDKTCAAAYVCMSNIYAAAGMQDDADKVEAMRVENEAWKKPGCSWWIDTRGNTHSFLVGETKHPQSKSIYAKLQDTAHKLSQE